MGLPPVDGIGEPPEVFTDLLSIWHAFHDLSCSRPSGFGPGALSWQELSCYCADHGIDGQYRLRFVRLLRAMDCTFLVVTNRDSKAKREEKRRDHRSGTRD